MVLSQPHSHDFCDARRTLFCSVHRVIKTRSKRSDRMWMVCISVGDARRLAVILNSKLVSTNDSHRTSNTNILWRHNQVVSDPFNSQKLSAGGRNWSNQKSERPFDALSKVKCSEDTKCRSVEESTTTKNDRGFGSHFISNGREKTIHGQCFPWRSPL